jgi:hypothetical protein
MTISPPTQNVSSPSRTCALGLALQALGSGGEELLAPFPEEAVGDVVLATELGHRLRAAQRREHDLGLLLRGELPVLANLAQRRLLLG